MADNTTPQNVEVLKLQLQVTQLQAQLIATQAEVARYQHRDLLAESGRLQQALAQTQQRITADPPTDEATRAELARIAKLPADELPQIVTRQMPGDDGKPVLVNQQGQPLTVIERAILDRADELRRQASGG